MVKIKIIAGSTRPGRFNIQVANWAYAQAQKHVNGAEIELVDLEEVNLPLFDEPMTPSTGKHEKEHTKRWARIVDDADGFLVVTPEYNHSIPAALKNAFDYLFREWNHKPIAFVSYGSAAGGARAVEHLRGVAGELKMYDIREQILLTSYWNNMTETGEYQFTDEQENQLQAQLTELIFWAKHMKIGRQELKQLAT